MRYIDQWKKGDAGPGTYGLTVAFVLFSLVVSSLFTEWLATSYLGFSLTNIPENVDLNALLSLMLLPFAVALLTMALCIRYLHHRPIVSLFTAREHFDWKRFFLSFFIWGAVSGIFLSVMILNGAPIKWNFNPSTFLMLTLVSLFLMPLQTTAEEVFFRGFLLQGLGRMFGKAWISILITSVLFGLLHFSNPEVDKIGTILLVFYMGTGLFLALLTHFDNGLELSMGYHAVNNIFAALILTNDWQAFHTDALFMDYSPPAFGWEAWMTLLLFQPLLLLLFGKIYRWKDWKKNLLN